MRTIPMKFAMPGVLRSACSGLRLELVQRHGARLALTAAVLGASPGPAASQPCDGPLFLDQSFQAGDAPLSVAIADLDADGIQDLAVANRFNGNVSVLLGNGDGTFQAQRTFHVGFGPRSVAIADLDADGVQDLAVATRSSDDVSVLLGNGEAERYRFDRP